MNATRLAGVAIAIVGGVFLAFGVNAADAPVNDLMQDLTGRYSDRITIQIAGGTAALIVGAILALNGRR